ncbi:MAG: 4a-hydroxytetrahydrobiopterin dehydratase [Gammaproteobacteria bacterium]|nr:MAG: 4a-hydroxytetrahydrobiopterin dehydratase [Gammaproteobacteria bacterium]
MNLQQLANEHCQPRKGAEHALDNARTNELLRALPGWSLAADGKAISKNFKFSDFHRTIGFVNALAYFANREDHHPDLEVGYGHCRVRWSTHDVGGLSLNDFICAAKTEVLL